MPRNKDKKSGETKDEDRKPKATESSDPKESKEFYWTQIRHLEEQLERYQRKCDELEVQSEDFTSQYSTLEKEKKDVVEYLKLCLAQKEEQLSELTESLVRLQQAKDLDQDSLELQLRQLRQEFQERSEKLTSENMTLAAKLSDLEEFLGQKKIMVADMESLKEQLANQKEEHKGAIYSLQKKAVLDNDRLKKEMHSHMEAEMQHFSEQKMPETTRQALRENAEMRSQLGQLLDRNVALLQENDTLLGQRRALRIEVDVLQPLLNQVTRRSHSHQKVAEQLTEKCKQLQVELKDCSSAHQEHQQLHAEHTGLLAEMDTLRQHHASVLEECSDNRAEVDRLGAELEEERRKRSQLESIQQEAAFALKQALTDEPPEDSELVAVRRNQMLQKLLAVLDSAAQLGIGPALAEFIPEKSRLHERQTSGPAPTRAGTLNPVPRSRVQLSHYRPGDLGLVPAPAQKHSAAPSKTGPLTRGTRLLLHSKPSSQKTSSLGGPSAPASLAPQQADSAAGPLTSRNASTRPSRQ